MGVGADDAGGADEAIASDTADSTADDLNGAREVDEVGLELKVTKERSERRRQEGRAMKRQGGGSVSSDVKLAAHDDRRETYTWGDAGHETAFSSSESSTLMTSPLELAREGALDGGACEVGVGSSSQSRLNEFTLDS